MTDEPLRFIHISDTHIHSDPEYTRPFAARPPLACARALVRELQALPFEPNFILHTGDVAYDPDPNVFPFIRELFEPIAAPMHWLVGNHDDGQALQRELMGRAAEQLEPELRYEFEAGGVQILCLDSNGPRQHLDHPSGWISDTQLAWLAERCEAKDPRPLVVAVHHNPIPLGVPWLDNWMRMENGEALHNVLLPARDRIRGVFHGHIHQSLQATQDGILYVAAPSAWCQLLGFPIAENDRYETDLISLPGFNLVTIHAGRTTVRQHYFAVDSMEIEQLKPSETE